MAASAFQPQPYQAEGGFNLEGLPLLLGALGGTALALGWLISFVGQWLYLIVVFPALVGVGLFVVGKVMACMAKMRNPWLGGLLGLVSAIVAMVANHYFDYLRFMEEQKVIAALPPPGRPWPPRAQDLALLAQIKKVKDFRSFMEFSAREGVTIAGRGGKGGFNLGYTGTWIYWLVELAVVAFMAAGGLVLGAREPFCSGCNSWKHLRQLGSWPVDQQEEVLAILHSGDLSKLPPAWPGGPLVLSIATCFNCGSRAPVAAKLELVRKSSEGHESRQELDHLSYPGEALEVFDAFFLTSGNTDAGPSV